MSGRMHYLILIVILLDRYYYVFYFTYGETEAELWVNLFKFALR